MQKRDLWSAAAGAALASGAILGMRGVSSSTARTNDVARAGAGESALAGETGRSGGGGGAGAHAGFDGSLTPRPLEEANENLVEQVHEYQRRLDAIAGEKAMLEASLKKTEEQLAAAQSEGGVGKRRNEWDLTQDEWKDLAKNGQVNWRTPCYERDAWTPSADTLDKLGLAPQDGATLRDAYDRSYRRLWAQIRPICAQELGTNGDVLERIGPDACVHLVYDIEIAIDKNAAMEAHTQVAEIRAGLRPEPAPGEKVHPVLKLFLLLSRANAAFESDLAKTFGPDEAHVLAYSDDLCHDQKRVTGGKKR